MAKLATRENLIEVGLRLIRAEGYTATGINQILEEAGVPKGSFYHHFTTKDDFVMEVIRRYVAGEQDRIERLLGAVEGSPLKRLRRYFKDLMAAYGSKSGVLAGCLLGNMSLEVGVQNQEIRELIRQGFQGWQNALAKTLREAVEAKELPKSTKADQMAALLVNNWEGAQVRAKAEQNDKPLELFFENAFEVLLRA